MHELGTTPPNRGGEGGSIECILGLHLPWSIENAFHFEMFFLNSKFHEIRRLGGCFHPQRSGDNELHLCSKFFFGVTETIFTQQIFPKIKNQRGKREGERRSHFPPKKKVGMIDQWFYIVLWSSTVTFCLSIFFPKSILHEIMECGELFSPHRLVIGVSRTSM